jgi:RNA polymerase sigma-70 factor (ECF subfamily)
VFHEAAKVTDPDDHRSGTQREKRPITLFKDEELVARAQNDDPRATEELIGRYQQKAYAIAYHMCFGDSEAAQDLTQEAFLRVFRNIKKFKRRSSFYTWLYRIVVNTCIDGIRRLRRRERIFSSWGSGEDGEESSIEVIERQPDMAEASDPMNVLSGKQLTLKAREVLMSISEKQRVVFQLKVLREMSIPEIAHIMKMAEGTVKSHLFRATHVLREALKDWAEP